MVSSTCGHLISSLSNFTPYELTLFLDVFYFVYSSIFIFCHDGHQTQPYLCAWYRVVFGVCTLWQLVPSIIDGQGQRACRSHSTQPECDKATQSDRATGRFPTPFIFDSHFTHFRTPGTCESHREKGGKIEGGERKQWGGSKKKKKKSLGKYIVFHFQVPKIS